MDITSDLADRWYDIMVETLGSPDDYRRWSFVYAMINVNITVYHLDSTLGPGGRFLLKNPPIVACTQDIGPDQSLMVQAANRALAEYKIPKRHKRSSSKAMQMQNT
jgi:hypothetical protein